MTLPDLLSRLQNVHRSGNGYSARCPAHDDRKASLSVRDAGDRLLMHCHAGCRTEAILAALGIGYADLFAAPHPSSNGQAPKAAPPSPGQNADPLGWLAAYCGVPRSFVESLPVEADGTCLAFRFGGLAVRKLRPSGAKSFSWTPPGSPTPPLWPLPGPTLPGAIYLTEGETDCIIARYVGLDAYALTHGASGTLTAEQAGALKACGVEQAIITFDADRAGREGARKLADTLRDAGVVPVAASLDALGLVDPLAGQKDLRDAWLACRDAEVLRQALDKTVVSARQPEQPEQPELPPCSVSVVSEVCAADLKVQPTREIEYLPLLGSPGYIAKGWSTLVAAYPKAGKTELLARLCQAWTGEHILYVTEEPESIWAARLHRLPGDWRHVRLLFGLGLDPAAILARIKSGTESVVIVDTVRNLLGLQDETNNSEVARVLAPFVAAARAGNKTLILLHHVRKGGGEHGEGITGGHAFLGIVDVGLEILREQNLGENRRRIRGWGRLFPIEEAVYELGPDGTMTLLGSPKAVEHGAVKERVLAILGGEWRTRKELLDDLEDPKPAMEQLRLALNALVTDGVVERDPAEEKRGATYRYRLVTKPDLPRTHPMVVTQVPTGFLPAAGGVERADQVTRLLALAQAAGWPSVSLRPGISVAPGEECWRRFVRAAGPDDIRAAQVALRARRGDEGKASSAWPFDDDLPFDPPGPDADGEDPADGRDGWLPLDAEQPEQSDADRCTAGRAGPSTSF